MTKSVELELWRSTIKMFNVVSWSRCIISMVIIMCHFQLHIQSITDFPSFSMLELHEIPCSNTSFARRDSQYMKTKLEEEYCFQAPIRVSMLTDHSSCTQKRGLHYVSLTVLSRRCLHRIMESPELLETVSSLRSFAEEQHFHYRLSSVILHSLHFRNVSVEGMLK